MKKIDVYKNGYKVFSQNFFKLKKSFLNEFENIYKEKKFKSNHLNTAIINDLSSVDEYIETRRMFDEIIDVLKKNEYYDKLVFDDIWFIKSNKKTHTPKKLPFISHIDKIRKFKVMVYLNDVKLKDGPINFTKINPDKYELFRKNLKSNYKKKQKNRIIDIPKKNYTPLTGKFGTTIFFDSNTPHFAGKITKLAAHRNVVRFNFRFKEKNNNNFFYNLIKKLI
tara:strand:- start:1737 stop:2405 length:669 start_codon:yes stop_codon:yes gene_type:complete